jgi:RimJ/RimL family protein N-acetyltransferase
VTERELLRLHIEAVWGLALPALDEAMRELVLTQSLPPWSLYLGAFAQEHVSIWHPQVSPAQRVPFLERAYKADAVFDASVGMRREVVFQYPHIAPEQQAQAQRLARVLTADDLDLINAMRPEEAPITLKPQKAPYVGVVVDGRLDSLAHSSRRTPAACELGIDTLPDARRRGYAAATAILWTALVQQQGLVPIYSAFAWNTASLHLAQSIGYVPRIEGVYGPVTEDAE